MFTLSTLGVAYQLPRGGLILGKERSDSVVEGIADKGGDRRLDVGIADGLAVAVGGVREVSVKPPEIFPRGRYRK